MYDSPTRKSEEEDTESEDDTPILPKWLKIGEHKDTTSTSAIVAPEIAENETEDIEEPIMSASKPVRFCKRMCGYGLCHKCYVETQKKEEGNKSLSR